MTTVAYIANEFPVALEPYVADEIRELRRRGVRVICCSGKQPRITHLDTRQLEFLPETLFFQPLTKDKLLRAGHRLTENPGAFSQLTRQILAEPAVAPSRRVRSIGHTILGAALANELALFHVEHIHAHHGYFACWMAVAAARFLGISMSFTLHGSDLLLRADLLQAKLRACKFCITVSDFNRRYILEHYPGISASKILVSRLGVDVPQAGGKPAAAGLSTSGAFRLLSVGRLHPIKNHRFLIDACARLRDEGRNFVCRIAGEGPERPALEQQIRARRLERQVHLLGHVPHDRLLAEYRQTDAVVLTSLSEGIPVVLMEAMAHGSLVLAPAITGIPELVQHGRTGFLCEPGSLPDFLAALSWLLERKDALGEIRRAAEQHVAATYNRERNLRDFAGQFLSRISNTSRNYEDPLLQQVQLSL